MENIEIKARCTNLRQMEQAVKAAGALWERNIEQVDIYFSVNHGRLKLRRENGKDQALIYYDRPDTNSPRLSHYEVVPMAPGQKIARTLEQALGVKTTVCKRRQLWRLDNIRIHLDEVEGLGSFIEFEVEVLPGRDIGGCRAQADELMQHLAISPSDLIAGSYSDLLIQKAVKGESSPC
jgi:adenylate cyclase class 2